MKAKLGFVLGVSVGAGLGVIFARQSGKKTREAIRRTARSAVDEAVSTTATIADRLKSVATQSSDEVIAAIEAGKEAYQAAQT